MPNNGKREITLEVLSEVESEVSVRLKAIQHIKKIMKHQGIDSVMATGRPMVTRGVHDIDRFIHSCKRELGEL